MKTILRTKCISGKFNYENNIIELAAPEKNWEIK